ncbi:MAG: hypothetical protein A3F98_02615 [Candidatus Yanofskybacteria bacterium RIFCSPLOWO2_12_FULL_41_8]|nr:MAG: hypothetical protein A3F98_02615 [Candidatus Yanofskybacteria bacterium RIFCSPLOWO2_12_FULL_41_8]
MDKIKNNKNKAEKIFDKILKDKNVRKAIVTKAFEFFFPVYFHKRLEYETPPFHEEIFRILEDEAISLAVILAFRGSAKSTLISVAYVLWAVFGIQQKKFVVIVGQTEQKARTYLMNIRRQLENNELLKKDLGPFEEERGPWGATALTISKLNAKIMIASVGQSIRGVLHDEHRPDLIILDDVEDLESVKTQESRDKLFNWLTGEVIPAGSRKTRIIAIGNLLHDDGLIRRLQKSIETGRPNSIYREYPIVDKDGDPLWPGKYPTPEDIEKERMNTITDASWAREYLLKIISTEEQLIRKEWIQCYDGPPPEENSYCATGIDPAISKDERADFTAMVSARVCGKGKNLKIYILPNIVNQRLTFLETIDKAEAISDSMGRSKLFVEDVSYQAAIIEQLKKDGYPVNGVKVHGQDKYARLSAVSHLLQSGKVLFPLGSEILSNQILGFGTEKHDDLVDAFTILLSKIIEEYNRQPVMGIVFKGEYAGEYDHLPPDEREKMMRVRENMRNMFLV